MSGLSEDSTNGATRKPVGCLQSMGNISLVYQNFVSIMTTNVLTKKQTKKHPKNVILGCHNVHPK